MYFNGERKVSLILFLGVSLERGSTVLPLTSSQARLVEAYNERQRMFKNHVCFRLNNCEHVFHVLCVLWVAQYPDEESS